MKKKKRGLLFAASALLAAAIAMGVTPMTTSKTSALAAEPTAVTETIPYRRIGEYLAGKATAASAQYAAANAYNNSGMDGGDGITQKHTNARASSKMWLSKADASRPALTVELNEINQLGQMFVWNYNENGRTDCGLRKVTVSASVDGESYETVGDFELKEASGTAAVKATNTVSGAPVDLGGVTAKFIRITPAETEGNWGGAAYGLSEVKIYEFKAEAEKNAYIKASAFHASAPDRVASQNVLVNGLGMDENVSSRARHDADPAHMWKGGGSSLTFNLKGSYPLGDIYIWNYNDPAALDNGVKEIEIFYENDGGKSSQSWKSAGTFTVPKATGSDAEKASIRIPMNNAAAQFVRLSVKSNYGGDDNGLSAVRFYCGEGDYTEAAHEWTSVLGTYTGYYGSDGTYTARIGSGEYNTPLDKASAETKTFFCFSDTDTDPSLGAIDEVNRTASRIQMPNNTYAVFTGNDAFTGEMKFMYDTATAGSNNVPIRPTRQGNSGRYWLGAPLAQNGKIYVTPQFIENFSGGMGFKHTAVDIAQLGVKDGTVDFNDLTLVMDEDKDRLCLFEEGDGGRTVLMNSWLLANTEEAGAPNPDGYVYNYGIVDQTGALRNLVAARVPAAQITNLTKYEYYTGSGWSKKIADLAPLADNVSPECSVTPISFGENKGKYMLVYQRNTQSVLTSVRIGDNPWGPFGEERTVYYTTEPHKVNERLLKNIPNSNDRAYCYNAKAHPALSKEGELILSYNINFMGGAGLDGHMNNIDGYHSRFMRYSSVTTEAADNSGIYGDKVPNGDNEGGKEEKNGCGGCGSAAAAVLPLMAAAGLFAVRKSR